MREEFDINIIFVIKNYLFIYIMIFKNILKVLGLIPARGGSKGIPLKNIKKLAGKPLVQFSIESAKTSKLLDRIIVSTDDMKIAQISKKLGAEVPFLRPGKISQDSSSLLGVVKHCLKHLSENESYTPDIISILQPTSPLRTSKMIDNSIKLLKTTNATSVLSVSIKRHHPFRSFWLPKKFLKPFKPTFEKFYQRQKLPSLYYPTGSIYTFWSKTLQQHNSIYGPKIFPLIAKEKEFHLDIDNPYELFVSEMTLLHWNNWFKKYLKR
tara:strand:- start:1277 stop:2077 length:801 start_codon:yes stop_codon:yes gene_type:complete